MIHLALCSHQRTLVCMSVITQRMVVMATDTNMTVVWKSNNISFYLKITTYLINILLKSSRFLGAKVVLLTHRSKPAAHFCSQSEMVFDLHQNISCGRAKPSAMLPSVISNPTTAKGRKAYLFKKIIFSCLGIHLYTTALNILNISDLHSV